MSIQQEGASRAGYFVVDRTVPFNPNNFLGDTGWTIAEQNNESLSIEEFTLEDVVKDGGKYFDAHMLQVMFRSQEKIPEVLKDYKKFPKGVQAKGTIFEKGGRRYTLSLVWRGLWVVYRNQIGVESAPRHRTAHAVA